MASEQAVDAAPLVRVAERLTSTVLPPEFLTLIARVREQRPATGQLTSTPQHSSLGDRTTGPIFVTGADDHRYGYQLAYEQLGRLCARVELPAGISPHSLRHSYATEAPRLGAALQDVQDTLGHADPRTTRRYDRARINLDRSPNYLLAASLTPVSPTA